MVIESAVYIVLDIPSPMAEKIRDFRRRFDPPRADLPVEITLTGSCGTGLVSKGQDLDSVLEKLQIAAKKIHPFQAQFSQVDRFPNTDIYFLTLKPCPFFDEARKIIVSSGIQFDPTPYPYAPHCTLNLRRPIENEQELLDLFFLHIPEEPFTLDLLSVYAMENTNSCELLHKIQLQ